MSTIASRNEFLKSQVCFAESIFEALILDIATGRPLHIRSSLTKDLSTIVSRLRSEGISFCTITLPTLSKAIIRSFKTGSFDCPLGFAKMKGTALPRLLSGLLKEIYADDGALLDQPATASITEALQILGMGYKLDIPHSEELNNEVIANFIKNEIEISQLDIDSIISNPIVDLARTMITEIFTEFSLDDVFPRHGPGSVATKERGNQKWIFKRKFLNIHRVFPYYANFVVSRKHLWSDLDWYKNLEVLDHGTATVILVPKDSRGPRLISMEPLEYQYIQQGVFRAITNVLEHHTLTRKRINFKDQTINQNAALQGSLNGSWATLDMKDASDRVSLELVKELFRESPKVLDALMSSRSKSTLLPSGQVIDLHKFAPMGSATCFPVESIVHYCLAVASIAYGYRISLRKAIRSVLVYGDDLIIRPQYANYVIEQLTFVGLRFNEDKSFIHGPFRESCGVDAFKGVNIAPIRWRKPWSKRLDAVSVCSFLDFASLLYQRGYCRAADLVWRKLEVQLGKLPTTPLTLNPSYLSRKTRFGRIHSPHRIRHDYRLCRLEHLAKVHKVSLVDDPLSDYGKLLKHTLIGSTASKKSSDCSYIINRWMCL